MIDPARFFKNTPGEPVWDWLDLQASPIEIATALRHRDHFVFLDSSEEDAKQGRFSYIAFEPRLVIKTKGRTVFVRWDGQWQSFEADPLEFIGQVFAAANYRFDLPDSMPFAGGAIGYLGYDLFEAVESYENLTAVDDLGLPDAYLAFYDTVLVFNHAMDRWAMAATPIFEPGPGGIDLLVSAITELPRLDLRVLRNPHMANNDDEPVTPPQSNFTRSQYTDSVAKAIDYIFAGDIYQINLSQRFETDLRSSPFDLFCCLREINPSYYGAYMPYDGHGVISSSPELFLLRKGDMVETRPIKGTRPRGKDEASDAANRKELEQSPKDTAELSMIVDLERNDLGRICQYGTVTVEEHRYIEALPTVFHTISTVRGRLRPEIGVGEILRGTFPGGSITGCPKIRSIEIIDELEPTRRNVYTGSVGYIGFNGDMVLNIAIRTLIYKGSKVYYQVGGGIVADSEPEAEYIETLDKAAAMVRALETVQSGQ